jgi:sortase B
MDYRCAPDGDGYSILYGHNMKSGAMFGTLKRFEDKAFFEAHQEGRILLADGWHDIEFFAFLTVRQNDGVIYGVPRSPDFYADVNRRARHIRALALNENDCVITLSTCSYEFTGARMVLLGKVI